MRYPLMWICGTRGIKSWIHLDTKNLTFPHIPTLCWIEIPLMLFIHVLNQSFHRWDDQQRNVSTSPNASSSLLVNDEAEFSWNQ